MFTILSTKIRRRETPFYDRLYRMGKLMRSFEIPVVRPLYSLLAVERALRLMLWRTFTRVFYYTPLFKRCCRECGKRLYLTGGIPVVLGGLKLKIGDDVILDGVSTLIGAKVFDEPTLTVGNNTHLGYMLTINVGRDVTIGANVLIGDRVTIMSYDGHPTNPVERRLPAPPESSKPVLIGDNVWIGANCTILKGVKIGEGAVVASGSVVTANIPPRSIAIGNPARCFPMML
jgi:acetyltransferase-like isoleucine patch superfamily enzyme